MKNIHHYQGMELHFLDESGEYAVYYRKPKPGDKPAARWNPYIVHRLTHKVNKYGYTILSHKKVARYADLKSAVCHVWELQGYGA